MSLSVQIGLLLALATALCSVLGFLYKHRGAVASPAVSWRTPVRSSLRLFRNPWYTLGVVVAMFGWAFHVGALALAPISLVQATIAGGLVLLTICADKLFGHEVSRREWIGVAMAAVGLAFLAATLGDTGREAHSAHDASTLWAFIGVVVAVAVVIAVAGRGGPRAGVLLGASAGLMWAASDAAIKAQTDRFGESIVSVLIGPLPLLILVASLTALLVSARSLQIGRPVAVIAITSVAANATAIASGPIVFAEPLPEDALGLSLRLAAFALVVVAAAMTPPPVEAVEIEAPAA